MQETSRVRNSVKNLITGFGGQFLTIILKFATRTVFIATLGKAYLGINGLFSDILTMLSLTELGLDTAINFKLYKPLADRNMPRIRALMEFYKTAYLVVGTAIFLIGILLIPLLPYLIKDYSALNGMGINAILIFMLYLLQSVSSYLFFASRSAIVKADQREYLLNIAGYILTLISNICQIVILLLWKDFVIYTAVLIVFNVLQNLVNAVIAKKFYSEVFVKSNDRIGFSEVKDIFKDLGALFIYKINEVVLKATDNIVLSTFIGLSVVGMYSNYLLFYTTIKTLLNKFYNAVKASMGNLFATADIEKRYFFFEIMNIMTVIFYGTAGVGVSVVADELVECWIGKDYVISQPFSVLMSIEILFAGLKNNLGQIRNISGAFRQMWYRPLMGIIINIVLSITLVGPSGICGVIIGTIVADICTTFAVDPVIIHRVSFQNYKKVSNYYRKNLMYIALLVTVGIADMCICSLIIVGRGWISVIAHIIICGVSVPASMLLMFGRTPEFRYLIELFYGATRKIFKKSSKKGNTI